MVSKKFISFYISQLKDYEQLLFKASSLLNYFLLLQQYINIAQAQQVCKSMFTKSHINKTKISLLSRQKTFVLT
jgi:hypothetical protein